jgi:hypothetical protein
MALVSRMAIGFRAPVALAVIAVAMWIPIRSANAAVITLIPVCPASGEVVTIPDQSSTDVIKLDLQNCPGGKVTSKSAGIESLNNGSLRVSATGSGQQSIIVTGSFGSTTFTFAAKNAASIPTPTPNPTPTPTPTPTPDPTPTPLNTSADLSAKSIKVLPGSKPGTVTLDSTTNQPLTLTDVVAPPDSVTIETSGPDMNNPLTWQRLGYGELCWKLEPFTAVTYVLPDPVQPPAGAKGTWAYTNVIVKAGSITETDPNYQVNTLYKNPAPGQTVWPDVNKNGIVDPGGRGADKEISHIVICANKISDADPIAEATPTATPTATPGSTTSPSPSTTTSPAAPNNPGSGASTGPNSAPTIAPGQPTASVRTQVVLAVDPKILRQCDEAASSGTNAPATCVPEASDGEPAPAGALSTKRKVVTLYVSNGLDRVVKKISYDKLLRIVAKAGKPTADVPSMIDGGR